MGLFGKSKPVEPPSIRREDMATAVAAVPPKELEWLKNALPEIEYLSNALPATSKSFRLLTAAPQRRWIRRPVLLLSRPSASWRRRQRRNNRGGEPTVHIFPFSELTAISFAPGIVNFGYFDLKDRSRVTLEIGKDKAWPGISWTRQSSSPIGQSFSRFETYVLAAERGHSEGQDPAHE